MNKETTEEKVLRKGQPDSNNPSMYKGGRMPWTKPVLRRIPASTGTGGKPSIGPESSMTVGLS